MILIMIGWEKRKIVKRKQSVTDKNIWEIIVVDKILKMILKNEIVFEKIISTTYMSNLQRAFFKHVLRRKENVLSKLW